jgi:hypothetical protein
MDLVKQGRVSTYIRCQKSNAEFVAVPIIFKNTAETMTTNFGEKNNKTQNKFLSNNDDDDDETVSYDLSNTFFFYN